MELEFIGLIIIILLYFKSQGTEKNGIFSQGTYNFQSLRNQNMAIADHEHVKISKLLLFHIKLLLKEDSILHILNEYHKRFECKSLFLFNQQSIPKLVNLEIFTCS